MDVLDELLPCLPLAVTKALQSVDPSVKLQLNEIRLRREDYLLLSLRGSVRFLTSDGRVRAVPAESCIRCSEKEIEETFLRLCDYSVHLHTETIRKGYITLDCGIRAGIAGKAVYDNGKLISVHYVSTLCFRLPQNLSGYADKLLHSLYFEGLPSVIIAGAPGSGKTTLLRDLASGLTDFRCGRMIRCTVVDEREELSMNGSNTLKGCDVLSGFKKAEGIELALRTLSPQMIICDEIATEAELDVLEFGYASGCAFALSVHAGSLDELKRKRIVKRLVATEEFSYIVLLQPTGYQYEILSVKELWDEICGNTSLYRYNVIERHNGDPESEKEKGNLLPFNSAM